MSDEVDAMYVASEILGYIESHPDAADTEEHIRNWWLSARDVDQGCGPVTSSLEMLEKNGFIEHIELPDQRVVYRLRRDHMSPNQGGGQG